MPEPAQRHRSNSEIALAELDRVLGAEVRFGVVLANAAYGSSSLTWAVGIPRTQKVYSLEVGLTWPVAPRGRPRPRGRTPTLHSELRWTRRADVSWLPLCSKSASAQISRIATLS